MPRDQNVAAIKQATEQFAARQLDAHLKLYNPSVLHHGFSARIRPGVAGLRDGKLADIAPTLLALLHLPQPKAMSGQNLVRAAARATA